MQGGLATVVARVDVVAAFDGDPDRLKDLRFLPGKRPAIFARIPDGQTGGDHQGRGAVRGRHCRVGARLEQHLHCLDVGHLGRQHERGCSEPVEPVALSVPHPVTGHPGVHVDPGV